MTDLCTETPDCRWAAGHLTDHPCGGGPHYPGEPCEFCGQPLGADETGRVVPCPDCWQPFTIADAKAFFAEEGLDTVLTVAPAPHDPPA